MKIEGRAIALRIYIGESDSWHGQPLHMAIILKARQRGMAGATVIKGIEGFGANSRIHTANTLRLSEDLPLIIEIVDSEERIKSIIPELDEMIREGMMTMHETHVIKYVAQTKKDQAPGGGRPA